MRQWSAFEFYLRTGRRRKTRSTPIQLKFNPWHDPEDGRFTFSGQGRYFAGAPGPTADGTARRRSAALLGQSADQLGGQMVRLAQFRPNPRVRMGGNGGPPLYDPRTLEDAFPGLGKAPGGAIIGLADDFLDLTGPARTLTTELAKAHAKALLQQIRALEPNYRLEILEPGGFPSTADGQTNLIDQLRFDRAKAFYRKGELRPLQVETLRFLQRKVDKAYEKGLQLLRDGQLNVRLSSQEALGNYVDALVRDQLRDFYRNQGISLERGQPAQVNRRAYIQPERTYSIPDSKVGDIAFDVSLTAKTISTPQIRNFFRSEFRPSAIVIVRPNQIGSDSTYVIRRPTGW